MLETLFIKLLEIGIQASFFILAVILIRLCFKRLPKRYVCVLWALVAVRLVLPFEINSSFSLVPDTSQVLSWAEISLSGNVLTSNNQTTENTPAQDNLLSPGNTMQSDMTQSNPLTQNAWQPNTSIQNNTGLNANNSNINSDDNSNSTDNNTGIGFGNGNGAGNNTDTGNSTDTTNSTGTGVTTKNLASLLSRLWLLGALALLSYDLASYLRLKFRLREAIHAQDNIWYSDQIPAPFVLGYLKPRIYMPFSIQKEQMPYIIAHEQAHILHFDHLAKLFAALLVCVYWFNPFIWIAYLFYCKDLELACDERVIAKLGNEEKKSYSEALLICSVTNKALLQSPLSFSEVAIKDRIVNILNYKKPGFWGVVLAVVVCVVAGVCFLTSPDDEKEAQIDAKTVEFIEQTTVDLLNQVTVTYHQEDGFHELPDTLSPDAYYRILTYGTKDLQFYGLINGEAIILRDGDNIYPLYDLQWPRLNANDNACIDIYKYDYDSDGELEYALYKVQTDQNGVGYTGMTILEIEDDSLHTVPFTLADIETQLARISFEYADDEETISIYIDSEDPAAILDVAWVNKMYNQSFTRLNSLSEGVFVRERDYEVEISTFVGFIQPEEESTGYVAASFSAPVTYSADGQFLIGDITIDYLLDDPDLVTQYSTQLDDYPGTVQHTGVNQFTVTVDTQDYGCLVATDPATGEPVYVWPDDYIKENVDTLLSFGNLPKDYPLEIVNDKVQEVPAQVLTEDMLEDYAFGNDVLEMTYKLHPYGIKQYILRENGTLNVNIGYEAPDHLVFQYLTFQISEDAETAALEGLGSGYYLLQMNNVEALAAFRETYTGEGHVLPADTNQLPWDWLLALNGEENDAQLLKESILPTLQQNFQFGDFAAYNLRDRYNGFIISEKVVNGDVFTEFRYQDGTDDIIILADIQHSEVISLTFNGEEKPLPEYRLEIATGSIGGSYATLYYLDVTGDGQKELIFTDGYQTRANCHVFNPATMEEYPIDADVSHLTSKLEVTLTDFEPEGGHLSFKLAYEDLTIDAKEQIIFSFDENNDTTKMTLAEANEYFSYTPETETDYIAYEPETGRIETNVWIRINNTVNPEYIGHLNAQYVWDDTAGKFVTDLDTVRLESLSGVVADSNSHNETLETKEPAVNAIKYTPTADMIKAMMEETAEDRPKDITIYHSESRSDEELAVLYAGDGYSLYLPLNWDVNVEGLAAPIKMMSEGSNYRRVWIEYYENADFLDIEEQFIADGYIYNTDSEKWQKTEDTTITKARLVTLENGICAVLSYHDDAYPDEPWENADAMADTCIITDIPEKNTLVQESDNVYYPTEYYYSPAQYMKDIDWENVSTRITNEENEALQKYLPVLNGEKEFIWIYLINDGTYNSNEGIHVKKQVTIRELLADQLDAAGVELVEPIVGYFCFADIFQTGSTDMAILLRNQDYEWLLFHEEDDVIYCIDMYVRWFSSVQEDGLYMGSSGADHQSYHRLSFADGDFTEEMVAEVIRDELYIDGVIQSAAEYEAWKKENLAPLVPVYTPIEEPPAN